MKEETKIIYALGALTSAQGMFTPAELEVIRHDIGSMPWQPEKGYDERRSILKKLDNYLTAREGLTKLIHEKKKPKNGKAAP